MARTAQSMSDRTRKLLKRLLLTLSIIGWLLFFCSPFLPRGSQPRELASICGLLLMSSMVLLAFLSQAETKAAKLTEIKNGDLAERVASISRATRNAVDGLYIVESDGAAQRIDVTLYQQNVFVKRRTLEEVSDPAIDFGIAYELTDKGYTLQGVTVVGFIFGLLTLKFLPAGWTNAPMLEHSTPLLNLFVLCAWAALACLTAVRVGRLIQVAHVKRALAAVPTPAAAEEWFQKSIQDPSPSAGKSESWDTTRQRASALADLKRVVNSKSSP